MLDMKEIKLIEKKVKNDQFWYFMIIFCLFYICIISLLSFLNIVDLYMFIPFFIIIQILLGIVLKTIVCFIKKAM